MKDRFTFALALLLLFGIGLVFGGVNRAMAFQDENGEEEIEPPPPLAIPVGYRYDPAGRRDPFVNPVPPPPAPTPTGPVVPAVRPQGLGGVLLNEAQLMGVVTSPEEGMNVVVIQAPGNRTFVARPGDELLDVIISEIRRDTVVFEVKPLEGADDTAEREEVVRPVRAAPGE